MCSLLWSGWYQKPDVLSRVKTKLTGDSRYSIQCMAARVDEARNSAFLESFDREVARRNLNPEKVAELGGFDSSSITHIRKNRKNVGLILMRKIANALDLDEDYVAAWASNSSDTSGQHDDEIEKDIQKIRQLYKRMSPEARDQYLRIGQVLLTDTVPIERSAPRTRARKARA